MTNAFSVLSLKRNRSSSNNNKGPVSKLSKIKSGLSKLTNSITHHETLDNRRTSFIGLFQYFRNNEEQKGIFDSDRHYEYNQYHNIKKNQKKQDMEINIHTLPIHATPKLTSILIKRSGTTPSSLSQSKKYNVNPKRTRAYSNATLSNMTINSEDLTAKEFANIAEDLVMHTVSSNYTTSSYFQDNSFTCCLPTTNELKIWDNKFWFHPEETACRKDTTTITATVSSSSSLDRKLSIKSTSEPPILHELRRMGTRNSEKDACVIKKGRFEIQLNSSSTVP
ncbi:hypothetical protein INT48_005219 [Thamnidium elegans]|uniref:Uncharacterized protein n=1 Tax=Thamnidium elegans TaxID=101142 RepID=A0A8H7STI6_9FUNG|nr:hypothetical protein INT48_005219 [Thamnidium elegans]